MVDIQITKNLWLSEFECGCGCGLDKINHGIIHRLQAIRDFLNGVIILPEPIKIIITSGCRCRIWNKQVGGKDSSRHLIGKDREEYKYPMGESDAVDFTLSKPGYLPLIDYILGGTWTGGYRYYPDKKMIHVDLRSPPMRW